MPLSDIHTLKDSIPSRRKPIHAVGCFTDPGYTDAVFQNIGGKVGLGSSAAGASAIIRIPVDFRPELCYGRLKKSEDLATTGRASKLRFSKGEELVIAARKPLYQVFTDHLLKEIVPGRLKEGYRLPSEAELAEQLDVSRTTLRKALGALAEEGFIQKIHSIGSFVTQNVRGTVAGIEALERFTETIRRRGCKGKDVVRNIAYVELDDEMAAALDLGKGRTSILIESILLADGSPVIYCRDVLAAALLDEMDLDFAETHRPQHEALLDFLEQKAGVIVSYASLILTLEAAAETASQRLRVKRGTPLLCLSGIAYDSEHRPLYHAISYFITDRCKFTLVRRRFLIRRPTRNTVFGRVRR